MDIWYAGVLYNGLLHYSNLHVIWPNIRLFVRSFANVLGIQMILPHLHLGTCVCNIGYPSEPHFKPKSRKISFVQNIRFNNAIVLEIYTEHDNITVQNLKTIGQRGQMLWTNEISRDLSLRWVSYGYPILHSSPGFYARWHTLVYWL